MGEGLEALMVSEAALGEDLVDLEDLGEGLEALMVSEAALEEDLEDLGEGLEAQMASEAALEALEALGEGLEDCSEASQQVFQLERGIFPLRPISVDPS